MSEDNLLYKVCVTPADDLKTVGRYNLHKQVKSTMIVHLKLDPISGDLFALSYDIIHKPYLCVVCCVLCVMRVCYVCVHVVCVARVCLLCSCRSGLSECGSSCVWRVCIIYMYNIITKQVPVV